jgi:hypothetical protein
MVHFFGERTKLKQTYIFSNENAPFLSKEKLFRTPIIPIAKNKRFISKDFNDY